ncbi:hypothetical protein [Cyanobium sp. Morenito 9A2]|uniref:hypothetical protein n=1 Tax=Cyanobium sp. Morenito 9A2 TaxID=2823718 RepID=UPI0020CC2A46|nr:hypothetical protein [Cyanobium sp. Morenito 9A2]MCP9850282.1 hypothetical protein [Cyanobium sp. Morenito 9A2]
MAASCLLTPRLSATRLRGPGGGQAAGSLGRRQPRSRQHRRPFREAFSCTGTTALGLALVLTLVACLVAPEQPGEQASICQRHNGAAACRVW